MRLTGIDIKNFRGFDSLKVEDFGQLNVIVGKNNVGKTAFLEAIALCAASVHPRAVLNLNDIREIQDLEIDGLRSFFYNLSFANSPAINSTWVSEGVVQHRNVNITAKDNLKYQFEGVISNGAKSELVSVLSADAQFNQIDINTQLEDGRSMTLSVIFSMNGKGGSVNVSGHIEISQAVIFIPSKIHQEPILKRVGYLKENRLEGPLVDLLSTLDKRIKRIEVIGDRILIDIEGIAKFVPFGLMGDGIKKIMSIMASAIDTDSSTVILVDEIENGLHYSAHLELWKALITTLKSTKAQFFATTHSEETLRYLIEALEEFPEFKQEIRCFDLANTKLKGFQAYKYTAKGLAGAIENETEIRL